MSAPSQVAAPPATARGLPPALPCVLYDGGCGLCDRAVRAILRRDPEGQFHFAPLQSAIGQALLAREGMTTHTFDTLVLVDADGHVHLRSDAVLGILAELPRWRWMKLGRAFPRIMRDALYGWIARRRHRLFPPPTACIPPRPEWRSRFLS